MEKVNLFVIVVCTRTNIHTKKEGAKALSFLLFRWMSPVTNWASLIYRG